MATALLRRVRSLDINALAELTGWALGLGAFVGAVACTIQLIARI
jgi:hypothetical protein